jgi:hypothetical protein
MNTDRLEAAIQSSRVSEVAVYLPKLGYGDKQYTLCEACKEGDEQCVKKLLREFTYTDNDLYSALSGALSFIRVLSNRQQIIFLPLMAMSTAARTKFVDNHLTYIQKYDSKLAVSMIESKVDISNMNLLTKCAETYDTSTLRYLLSKGIDKDLDKAIVMAIDKTSPYVLDLLCEAKGPLGKDGYQLIKRCMTNSMMYPLAKNLIAAKADVTPSDSSYDPAYPLLTAAANCSVSYVTMFVESKADVNYNNGEPLHNAVLREDMDIIRLLIKYNANVNPTGYCLLSDSIVTRYSKINEKLRASRDLNIFKFLLEAKANVGESAKSTSLMFYNKYDDPAYHIIANIH